MSAMPRREKDKKIEEILGRLDASERRDFFRRLRDADFLHGVFDNIREGIVIFDRFLQMRFANFAARRIFSIPDDFDGQKISSYLKNFDWKEFLSSCEKRSMGISRREIEIDYPDRKLLLFYVIPQEDERDAFVGIFHDITEISEKTREENERQRNGMVSLLAAGVAHEIGNPLNSIAIHLQLLEKRIAGRRNSAKEDIELLNVAKQEIARLENIIKRFLQALRIDSPSFSRCDVKRLVIETLSLMKPDIEGRRMKVNCEISDSIPPLRVDGDQIKQAFFNIVKNAVESMQEGGTLDIACAGGDEFARISFKDSGGGVAPELIDKIFNPYFTTKKTGSGLGLMVVDRIVKANNGRLSVDSSPETGTTFTVELPLFDKKTKLIGGTQKRELAQGD